MRLCTRTSTSRRPRDFVVLTGRAGRARRPAVPCTGRRKKTLVRTPFVAGRTSLEFVIHEGVHHDQAYLAGRAARCWCVAALLTIRVMFVVATSVWTTVRHYGPYYLRTYASPAAQSRSAVAHTVRFQAKIMTQNGRGRLYLRFRTTSSFPLS